MNARSERVRLAIDAFSALGASAIFAVEGGISAFAAAEHAPECQAQVAETCAFSFLLITLVGTLAGIQAFLGIFLALVQRRVGSRGSVWAILGGFALLVALEHAWLWYG